MLKLQLDKDNYITDFQLSLAGAPNSYIKEVPLEELQLAFVIESTNEQIKLIAKESYISLPLDEKNLSKVYFSRINFKIALNKRVQLSELKIDSITTRYPNSPSDTIYRVEGIIKSIKSTSK